MQSEFWGKQNMNEILRLDTRINEDLPQISI